MVKKGEKTGKCKCCKQAPRGNFWRIAAMKHGYKKKTSVPFCEPCFKVLESIVKRNDPEYGTYIDHMVQHGKWWDSKETT